MDRSSKVGGPRRLADDGVAVFALVQAKVFLDASERVASLERELHNDVVFRTPPKPLERQLQGCRQTVARGRAPGRQSLGDSIIELDSEKPIG